MQRIGRDSRYEASTQSTDRREQEEKDIEGQGPHAFVLFKCIETTATANFLWDEYAR
jgi:hypothetical protein